MTACSCCGTPAPPQEAIEPIGVQRDYLDRCALILFNCPGCHTTLSVPWSRASALLVAKAMRKEGAGA